jgi:hypothetical protein
LCLSTGPEKTFGHDLGMHITLRCGDNYDSEWTINRHKYIEILEDWQFIGSVQYFNSLLQSYFQL